MREDKNLISNKSVLWKIRRKLELVCSYCKPNRGENRKHKLPKPDKHKNIDRSSIRKQLDMLIDDYALSFYEQEYQRGCLESSPENDNILNNFNKAETYNKECLDVLNQYLDDLEIR